MPTVYERITSFNAGRLPHLLKIKYRLMAANSFSFYRGTCHLFYEDLAAAPPLPDSPITWICGDLHLENFGSYKGDDRQVYFDLNDFDEAMLAPALWEVTRMVTSIFVAFDSMGLKKVDAIKTAQLFLDTYTGILAKGKARIVDPRTASGVVKDFLEKVEKRKPKELLKSFAEFKKGKFVQMVHDERHFDWSGAPEKSKLIAFMEGLLRNGKVFHHEHKVLDCIFRVAGTGSLGIKRYMFLLKRTDTKNKYLFVDMKQTLPSSLKPYVKIKQPVFDSEAGRVIAVQQRMENVSPALLNAVLFQNDPYVVKQMQPISDKIDFEKMEDDCGEIRKVITDMAQLTASAQLRSSGRQGSAIADEMIIFGNNSGWQDVIVTYAQQYALQVKKDYDEYSAAYKKENV